MTTNLRLRSGLVKKAAVMGVTFGSFMFLIYAIVLILCLPSAAQLRQETFVFCLVLGVLSGLALGAIMVFFLHRDENKLLADLEAKRPPMQEENLVKQGKANCFLDRNQVSGYLYLSSKNLLFKTCTSGPRSWEMSIPRDEIATVSSYRLAGIFPTGLKVVTTTGRAEHFVVERRQEWITEIRKIEE